VLRLLTKIDRNNNLYGLLLDIDEIVVDI